MTLRRCPLLARRKYRRGAATQGRASFVVHVRPSVFAPTRSVLSIARQYESCTLPAHFFAVHYNSLPVIALHRPPTTSRFCHFLAFRSLSLAFAPGGGPGRRIPTVQRLHFAVLLAFSFRIKTFSSSPPCCFHPEAAPSFISLPVLTNRTDTCAFSENGKVKDAFRLQKRPSQLIAFSKCTLISRSMSSPYAAFASRCTSGRLQSPWSRAKP
jgi:hypothetical protein